MRRISIFGLNAIDLDRFRDVLELLFAEIFEFDIHLGLDVIEDSAGNAHLAGRGKPL